MLMETLQHNVSAFIDWNLILASTDGPSYLGSFIEAYILANDDFTVFYNNHSFMQWLILLSLSLRIQYESIQPFQV